MEDIFKEWTRMLDPLLHLRAGKRRTYEAYINIVVRQVGRKLAGASQLDHQSKFSLSSAMQARPLQLKASPPTLRHA